MLSEIGELTLNWWDEVTLSSAEMKSKWDFGYGGMFAVRLFGKASGSDWEKSHWLRAVVTTGLEGIAYETHYEGHDVVGGRNYSTIFETIKMYQIPITRFELTYNLNFVNDAMLVGIIRLGAFYEQSPSNSSPDHYWSVGVQGGYSFTMLIPAYTNPNDREKYKEERASSKERREELKERRMQERQEKKDRAAE